MKNVISAIDNIRQHLHQARGINSLLALHKDDDDVSDSAWAARDKVVDALKELEQIEDEIAGYEPPSHLNRTH